MNNKLFDILKNNEAVFAIVANRIGPVGTINKQPFPKIVYENVTSDELKSNTGVVLTQYDYQIDCITKTSKKAKQLEEAVKDCLRFYKDAEIQLITIENSFNKQFPLNDGEDIPKLYGKTIIVKITPF